MSYPDPQDIAARYIALWNEPDPALRRKAIEDVFAENAAHVLHPPQEIREIAAGLGFPASTLEAHGHDAIEVRVASSYDRFVGSGRYVFRPAPGAIRLNEVVKLTWETVAAESGERVGGGVEVLVLDGDGRVAADYMFPGL
ncbi:hypothetical protein [Nonomuraea rhodomycinica]|uniref:SnoaL-like domain-containing protein n=1 Tax=Nonomuraea rhodomycinica TaxID=1712872 RepID=A0A7Y6ISB7_9ACTN|nr:hypothetical protein [Nonomuraea rhodomycinica]NUW43240.1 hypothetical protein [Nonomuraea rhodomycinica]